MLIGNKTLSSVQYKTYLDKLDKRFFIVVDCEKIVSILFLVLFAHTVPLFCAPSAIHESESG